MAQTGTGVDHMRHPAVLGSGDPCPSALGRSQRVTTPHCSCGTTQISRAWGSPNRQCSGTRTWHTAITSKRWLAFTGVSFSWCFADILELAVLALARIMCANIHSQNGTAILAQELLSRKWENLKPAHPHQGWRQRRIFFRYHHRKFRMHSRRESLNLAHHWNSCWWGSQSPTLSSTDWGRRSMSQWKT